MDEGRKGREDHWITVQLYFRGESRGPPSAKKIIARTELCGTQRVKKLHSRISAASSLLQGHYREGENLHSRISAASSLLHGHYREGENLHSRICMKQHEALHIQGEQKLQSRIIDEAAVKQQFFSNAAS